MPEDATKLIDFLNNKNKYDLQELDIEGKTEQILEVRKVLSKRNLMINLDDKCQNMQATVDRFMTKLQILRERVTYSLGHKRQDHDTRRL